MQPDVLILGTSSNVGAYLKAALGPRAIATYHLNPVEDGIRYDAVVDDLSLVLDQYPMLQAAVLLLGETDPNKCIADQEKSRALNVLALQRVIDQLAARNIYTIFFSSQFIFDGQRGNYREDDPSSPILLYGRQKVEVEEYLATHHDDYAILRLSKAVGDQPDDGTLFPNWLNQLAAGTRELRCAVDQIQTPIYIPDIVEAVRRCLEQKPHGIFHLAGADSLARTELLQLLLEPWEAQGGGKVDIIPCGINDFELPELRPLDVSLDSRKLAATLNLTWTPMRLVAEKATAHFLAHDSSNTTT